MAKSKADMHELSNQVFQEFARIESSLKKAGLHYGDGEAKANWDAFANTILGLENDPDIADAVKYMQASPPMKQFVRNGAPVWENVNPHPVATHELLLCVRRVRNNLFHGGKFNGEWFDPSRSADLLQHSLDILRACIRASHALRIAYTS